MTDFTATPIRQARYLHGDHLGSVDAITNENGAVVSRMSFDAHGNRRAASSAQGATWMVRLAYPANASAIDALRGTTPRGFTDHEMLDNVGLIHMNGRVYDPGIGRFLSVDPVFQFPENTQSLNPYSYVLNSPLTMTDPTGLMGSCTGEDFDMPCGGFGSNGGLMQDPGSRYKAYDGPTSGRGRTSTIEVAGGNVMSPGNGGSVAIDGNTLADFNSKGPDSIGAPETRSESDATPSDRLSLETLSIDGEPSTLAREVNEIETAAFAGVLAIAKLGVETKLATKAVDAMKAGKYKKAAEFIESLVNLRNATVDMRLNERDALGSEMTFGNYFRGPKDSVSRGTVLTVYKGAYEAYLFGSKVGSRSYRFDVPAGADGVLAMITHESGHGVFSRNYRINSKTGERERVASYERRADQWIVEVWGRRRFQ